MGRLHVVSHELEQRCHRLRRIAVVVHDEDATTWTAMNQVEFAPGSFYLWRLHVLPWKCDGKRTPRSGPVAPSGNATAVHFYKSLDERQADSQAPLRALDGPINLTKHV